MAPERIVTDTPATLAVRAAEWIADALREIVARQERCTLALAGGTTPAPVYRQLSTLPAVPWPQVTIFFGDERAVPPHDPRSNFRQAQDSLLSRVPLPPAQVHRMEAERADREAAARAYARLLPESLDILLLGVGEDGHIASLFPHTDALAENVRRVVPALGGVPLLPRLTITPPVIRGARRVCVLVAGTSKAAAVARALEAPEDIASLPAQLARQGTWILDRAAAADLSAAAR